MIKNKISETYFPGLNSDFVMREFSLLTKENDVGCIAVGFEAMVSSDLINRNILSPLMLLGADVEKKDLCQKVYRSLLTHVNVIMTDDFKVAVEMVNVGSCALFIDGIDFIFIADVKNFPMRSLQNPITENVIRGPQQGFTESIRSNTAILRKVLRDENLIIENVTMGKRGKANAALCYLNNITNDKLVKRLRNRLKEIEFDYIFDSGELEQYIESNTFSVFPQIMSTERPDMVAASLADGKLAVFLDGSPFALVLPITLTDLTHTVEDRYLRMPYANLMVVIRLIALLSSTLLSGMYIAIMAYHREGIPTELLFDIIKSRELVPFSIVTEILLLEIFFELIREASFRMPTVMGGTLGIVGGLVIGQAAVSANLFSPLPIIIVAFGGISAFVIPNYYLSYGVRIIKFVMIILGGIMGYMGIAVGLVITGLVFSSQDILGVPLVAPISPEGIRPVKRMFFVEPVYKREKRSEIFNPKILRKQPHISRKWILRERGDR
ncbi:MAG: spore germination protein [Eubacteriales bacterium]|nr:spore germination protein [Eubacteriales bacterium]